MSWSRNKKTLVRTSIVLITSLFLFSCSEWIGAMTRELNRANSHPSESTSAFEASSSSSDSSAFVPDKEKSQRFGSMIANALSADSLTLSNVSLGLAGFDNGAKVSLASSALTVAFGKRDPQAAGRLSGHFVLDYYPSSSTLEGQQLHEAFDLYYGTNGSLLTLDLGEATPRTYSLASSSLGDILYYVTGIANGLTVNGVRAEIQPSSFLDLLGQLQDQVDRIALTETKNGNAYSYEDDQSPFSQASPLLVEGTLRADGAGLDLTHIQADQAEFPSGDSTLSASFAADVDSVSNAPIEVPGDIDGTSSLDGIVPLMATIASIAGSRQFASQIDLTRKETETDAERTASLRLSGDFTDSANPIFQLANVSEGDNAYLKGNLLLTLKDQTVYAWVGSSLKGSIASSSVSSLMAAFSSLSGQPETAAALDSVGGFFGDSAFGKLLAGDWSDFNSVFLKGFEVKDGGKVLALSVDPSAFDLAANANGDPVSVTLTLAKPSEGKDPNNYVEGIAVSGLVIGDQEFGMTIDLTSISKAGNADIDPTEYSPLDGAALPMVALADILKSKSGAFDYSLSMVNAADGKDQIDVTGSLVGDLADVDLNGLNFDVDLEKDPNLNGFTDSLANLLKANVAITARLISTSGVDKYIDARLLDANAYLTLANDTDNGSKVMQNYMTGGDISDLSLAVIKLMESIKPASDEGSDANSGGLDAMMAKLQQIWSIQNGLDLTQLDGLFELGTVDDFPDVSLPKDTVVLTIDGNELGFQGVGKFNLALSGTQKGERSLLGLTVNGIQSGDDTISLSLTQRDEDIDPKALPWYGKTKPFDVSEYGNKPVTTLDSLVNGLFNLLNQTDLQYGLSLSMDQVASDGKTKLTDIQGTAMLDLDAVDFRAEMNVTNYDEDGAAYRYHPWMGFQYEGSQKAEGSKATDGQLKVRYSSTTDGAGSFSAKKSLDITMDYDKLNETISLFDQNGLSQNNLLYQYLYPSNSAINVVDVLKKAFDGNLTFKGLIQEGLYGAKAPQEDEQSQSQFGTAVKYLSWLKSIDIQENSIKAVLSAEALGVENGSDDFIVELHYGNKDNITKALLTIPAEDGSVTHLNLSLIDFKTVSGWAPLWDYDGSPLGKFGTGTQLDFNYLPIFARLLINTTDTVAQNEDGDYFKDFVLDGTFGIKMSALGGIFSIIDVSKPLHIELNVVPSLTGKARVKGYIRLGDVGGSFTEYFIRPDSEDAAIIRHHSNQMSAKFVNQKEMVKNMAYYILADGLEFDNGWESVGATSDMGWKIKYLVLFEVFKSTQNVDVSEGQDQGGLNGGAVKPEELITGLSYGDADADQSQYGTKRFVLNLNIAPLIQSSGADTSMMTINPIAVQVFHGKESGKDDQVDAMLIDQPGFISILSLVNVDLHLDATNKHNATAAELEAGGRYEKGMAYLSSQFDLDNPDYFYFTNFDATYTDFTHWFGRGRMSDGDLNPTQYVTTGTNVKREYSYTGTFYFDNSRGDYA